MSCQSSRPPATPARIILAAVFWLLDACSGPFLGLIDAGQFYGPRQLFPRAGQIPLGEEAPSYPGWAELVTSGRRFRPVPSWQLRPARYPDSSNPNWPRRVFVAAPLGGPVAAGHGC